MKETKWLTVAEASLLCSEMGLERTPKTIRAWARNEHVAAQKKSTSNGEMWILDKASLETKIKTEIEYRDQVNANQSHSDLSEPVQTRSDRSGHVRTSTDLSNPEQSKFEAHFGYKQSVLEGSNRDEPHIGGSSNPTAEAKIKDLENKVMTLSIDVGWRDKLLEKLQRENEKGQETLHAQARYIGHLESDLLSLGGKPNQAFLAAPKPKEGREPSSTPQSEILHPQRPHPEQSGFHQK